jgi:hypothetical protein
MRYRPDPRGWGWLTAHCSLLRTCADAAGWRLGDLQERPRAAGLLPMFWCSSSPCVKNGAMLTYFLTGFRSHVSTVEPAGAASADLPPRHDSVRGTIGRVGNLVTESADG